jgi:hypothetical protein
MSTLDGGFVVVKPLGRQALSLSINPNVQNSVLDPVAMLHSVHSAVLSSSSDSHLTIDVSRLPTWMHGAAICGVRESNNNYTLHTGRDAASGAAEKEEDDALDHVEPSVEYEGAEMMVSYDGGAMTHPAYGDFLNDSDAIASVQSCRVNIRDINHPLLMGEIWYSLLQLVPMVHPIHLEVDVKSCAYSDTMPVVLAHLKPALVTLDSIVLDHDWVNMIRDPSNGISNLTLVNCDLQGCATLNKRGTGILTHVVFEDCKNVDLVQEGLGGQ